jgi:hypothetical protein
MDQPVSASEVTAIVIALALDDAMVSRARAANAMLQATYPEGFRLDAGHPPHISIYAGFVANANLPKVYEATGAVLANEAFTGWELNAFKYYYIPLGPIGLAGIVVQPTLGLVRMQQDMIDAAERYTVRASPVEETFFTTPHEPDIHPAVVSYVAGFAKQTGKNFSPHVSIGLAQTGFLDALLAEPFNPFSFAPVGAAVYQIGNFGAARKELKALPAGSWRPEHRA